MTQDPYGRPMVGARTGRTSSMFDLEYPRSIGVFDTYAAAEKAVDHLADHGFPVQNLAIVGTDLRTVERVLARRTWRTVLLQGAAQGLNIAVILFFVLWIFIPGSNVLGLLLAAFLFSVLVSMLFAAIGYALSRGSRDFTSVQQTVATRYEVLCEHKVAEQAQELIAGILPVNL